MGKNAKERKTSSKKLKRLLKLVKEQGKTLDMIPDKLELMHADIDQIARIRYNPNR